MAALPPARIGFPLLPVPDETGRIAWPSLGESIDQFVRVLLQTRPGEQLMRPSFGAGLQEFVGRSDGVATRRELQERISEGLARSESRILLDAVEVFDDPAQPGVLRVEIRYRIRRTGAPQRFGVSVTLENG
jgi:phage baseplate assembly protein W